MARTVFSRVLLSAVSLFVGKKSIKNFYFGFVLVIRFLLLFFYIFYESFFLTDHFSSVSGFATSLTKRSVECNGKIFLLVF